MKRSQLESSNWCRDAAGQPDPPAQRPTRVRLQPADWTPRPLTRVMIGLDFGTSATKAAWRLGGQSIVRPTIYRPTVTGDLRYALPSVVRIANGSRPVFGYDARNNGDRSLDPCCRHHLKVLLAGKHNVAFKDKSLVEEFHRHTDRRAPWATDGLAEEYYTSLLLAHAMHESVVAVARELNLPGTELDAVFNVGTPIDHTECEEVWRSWGRVLACAEHCYRIWERLAADGWPYRDWRIMWDRADYKHAPDDPKLRLDDEARTFAVPEAVAVFSTFADSPASGPGMHALVDLGSGTTDLSVIRLAGDRTTFWYAARVVPIGCRHFELEARSVPEYKAAVRHGKWLWHNLKPIWANAYLKDRQLPDFNSMRVFVTGGGANNDEFVRWLSIPWWKEMRKRQVRFETSPLPEPEHYIGDEHVPFLRMAVAVGLTRNLPEFGDFVPPNQTPDMTPPRAITVDLGTDDGSGLVPRPGFTG